MDSDNHFRYWGKAAKENDSFHLLPYHCLDVAAVAQTLLENNSFIRSKLVSLSQVDEEKISGWLVFFIALHDLGKFSHSFQNLKSDLVQQLQNRQPEPREAPRHDSLGFMLWKNRIAKRLAEMDYIKPIRPRRESSVDYWARAVTGHHGQPPKEGLSGCFEDYFSEHDYVAAETFACKIASMFLSQNDSSSFELEYSKQFSWWLAGLTVLCDWLGSNRDYFPYKQEKTNLEDYWNTTLDYAENAISKAELLPASPSTLRSPTELFSWNQEKLTPLQEHCLNLSISDEPNLFVIEDVTGSGKTEASVILAHRMMASSQINGIYFALPTMATANAMYSRLASVYRHLFMSDSKPSLILAHGARDLSEDFRKSISVSEQEEFEPCKESLPASAHCSAWVADNRKTALLAEIGVGTIDQALLAVLPSRHQSLRLFGLLGKVLIVDEVHACDKYMNRLLCALLKSHAMSGGSAILLSASLPNSQRMELIKSYAEGRKSQLEFETKTKPAYPLVSHYNAKGLSETEVNTRESVRRFVKTDFINDIDKVTNLIANAVDNRQCVCWIRNTVDDARDSYQKLKQEHPTWDIDLFHARFAMADRLAIEKRIVSRFGPKGSATDRHGKVLIATQVVEQSLDIDFDVMISDLAPVDLLIQRAGRLCRHARNRDGEIINGTDQREQPTLFILSPSIENEPAEDWYSALFPKASYVYENHGQLWLTAKLLTQLGGVRMPEDARTLIEGVYSDDNDIPSTLEKRTREAEAKKKAQRSIGDLNSLKIQTGYGKQDSYWWDEAITPTRLGEEMTTVYLAQANDGKLSPWANSDNYQWALSAVQVRTTLITKKDSYEGLDSKVVKKCQEQLPAKGKWGVLIPLVKISENRWEGTAKNKDDKIVKVCYSSETGLKTEMM